MPVSNGSWTNVTSSRAIGTTYTNSSGRPIYVIITAGVTVGNGQWNVAIGGSSMAIQNLQTDGVSWSFIVLNGQTYSLSGPYSLALWYEFR